MSTSFLVAGSVGIVANYALFSQYTPVSLDLLLRHVSSVVQPVAALKSLLPALFGFLGGTLLLLVWNYLKVRVVRFLLDYNGWFLTPKSPLNKLWYMLMVLLVGTKNRGVGQYQDFLPSLPVPPLEKTAKKYLNSVQPLLTEKEYKDTKVAVKEFVERDGKKLQWLLKFRSWQMRNWIAEWWVDFIYLRQRTPICFNSNYYAKGQHDPPTTSMEDRLATLLYQATIFHIKLHKGEVENVMGGKVAPFCSNSCYNLTCATRIPKEEKDELVNYYGKEKPTHVVVYRQGKYYAIQVICAKTGKPYSPLTIRRQLEQIMKMAGDVRDETGVQNLTALPRNKWAKLYQVLSKSPVNRRSLHLIGSAITMGILETKPQLADDMTGISQLLFHGDGYSRWFDKSFCVSASPGGVVGANAEHSSLDATICGQLWEYMLTEERYDENGRCIELYPGEVPANLPTPTELKWEVDDIKDEISEATSHLANMIKDSDLKTFRVSYGKRVPKGFKLSPDGWFQMALQLAYYRMYKKVVLTYESATTRLYYHGRTETIRPVSEHSVAFVEAMDDPKESKDNIKKLLKAAIEYQCSYKLEAMRGLGVDRHLFGLYIIAKGLKLDPMPKMFTDKAFNFSFLLSTSQTPVRATSRWTLETSTQIGGFGCVCDDGYGISYIIVGEDIVNFSVHSKRSCPTTSTDEMCDAICKSFDDMKALFE